MEGKISDERLIEWLEGKEDAELSERIKADKDLRNRVDELRSLLNLIENTDELEVPAHVSERISGKIYLEQGKQSANFSWIHIAAAVTLLIIGFGMGRFSGAGESQDLVALKQEVESLKELTLTSALEQHSASERIMAVNKIEEVHETMNPELAATLINTLNSDDSPNVRYAALQAIGSYINDSGIRAELVKSLETQTDPLIQISLISILMEAEERSAIAPLKELIEKEQVSPEVKQQAEIAIQVLT